MLSTKNTRYHISQSLIVQAHLLIREGPPELITDYSQGDGTDNWNER